MYAVRSLLNKSHTDTYVDVRKTKESIDGRRLIASVFDCRRERVVYLVHVILIGSRLGSEIKTPRKLAINNVQNTITHSWS